MKKLVVIACAALAVVSVKAATVDWQYKIEGQAGGAADEFAGYTVYLVDKAYYDGLGGEVTKEAITGTGNYLSSGTVTQTGKSGKGANTKYVFSTKGNVTDDTLETGTTYNYYLVLVNGDEYQASSFSYAARDTTGTPDATASLVTVASTAVSTTPFSTGGGSGGGGGEGGGVPEPTSGLLLLVGGAMLALRRKQK